MTTYEVTIIVNNSKGERVQKVLYIKDTATNTGFIANSIATKGIKGFLKCEENEHNNEIKHNLGL